eukprot:TRINITY_DN6789_c0_g2_i1.p1 TRINITY_DN6789_c0_g2~~TRINITY_DN6789_c0_g2_i1.p1  ORF type:complete len:323 (+),score=49.30 TRINITY_DN6789_c0_g2_i1:102-1070(+)
MDILGSSANFLKSFCVVCAGLGRKSKTEMKRKTLHGGRDGGDEEEHGRGRRLRTANIQEAPTSPTIESERVTGDVRSRTNAGVKRKTPHGGISGGERARAGRRRVDSGESDGDSDWDSMVFEPCSDNDAEVAVLPSVTEKTLHGGSTVEERVCVGTGRVDSDWDSLEFEPCSDNDAEVAVLPSVTEKTLHGGSTVEERVCVGTGRVDSDWDSLEFEPCSDNDDEVEVLPSVTRKTPYGGSTGERVMVRRTPVEIDEQVNRPQTTPMRVVPNQQAPRPFVSALGGTFAVTRMSAPGGAPEWTRISAPGFLYHLGRALSKLIAR